MMADYCLGEPDRVTCERCHSNVYKEDCARTTDGSWICDNCQDEWDNQDNKEDNGE